MAVAVLWGGNISVIYPFIAVAMEGKSLHEWADKSIGHSDDRIRELSTTEADLQRQVTDVAEPDEPRCESSAAPSASWWPSGAGTTAWCGSATA